MSYTSAVTIVLFTCLAAGLATALVQRHVGVALRRHHHDVGSVVFLQLGVVFAVLLAFVFSEDWSQYNEAAQSINLEVGAMHGAAMIASTLPPTQAHAVLTAEQAYLDSVITKEWSVMRRRRAEDVETDRKLQTLITTAASLRLIDPNDGDRKSEMLSLLAEAHAQRETRIFQAGSGIPTSLWCVLIGFTVMLTVFVSFSGIEYRNTSVMITISFVSGIASILVVARLLDYPFEGALALRPTDFVELLGKVTDLMKT